MDKVYLLERISSSWDSSFIDRKGYKTKEEAIKELWHRGYNIVEEEYVLSQDHVNSSPYIQSTGLEYFNTYIEENRDEWYRILVLEL